MARRHPPPQHRLPPEDPRPVAHDVRQLASPSLPFLPPPSPRPLAPRPALHGRALYGQTSGRRRDRAHRTGSNMGSIIARAQLVDLEALGEASQERRLGGADGSNRRFRMCSGSAARRRHPEQGFAAAVLWAGTARGRRRSDPPRELWDIDVRAGARPEVTVWATARPRCDEVVVHRVRTAPEPSAHARAFRSRRRSARSSTWRAYSTPRQLEIAFESARRARLLTVESRRRALAALGMQRRRRCGNSRLTPHDARRQPPAESALEVLDGATARAGRICRSRDARSTSSRTAGSTDSTSRGRSTSSRSNVTANGGMSTSSTTAGVGARSRRRPATGSSGRPGDASTTNPNVARSRRSGGG